MTVRSFAQEVLLNLKLDAELDLIAVDDNFNTYLMDMTGIGMNKLPLNPNHGTIIFNIRSKDERPEQTE